MDEKKSTLADIIAEVRREYYAGAEYDGSEVQNIIDRIEAAHKRERDSVHHAMVLIAGIEMEGSEDPPRLWTTLEDAYDALSDALGTDGDATADMAEAEATGRHFVVKSSRNGAKMREALEATNKFLEVAIVNGKVTSQDISRLRNIVSIALSESPRNCDRLPNRAAAIEAYQKDTGFNKHPVVLWTAAQIYAFIDWLLATKKGENDAIK